MDRYFKSCPTNHGVADLHLIGVASMFIASKFEDHIPIKMNKLIEKACHGKFNKQDIKKQECDILHALDFQIQAPTTMDFLKVYLDEMLNIQILGYRLTKEKEK